MTFDAVPQIDYSMLAGLIRVFGKRVLRSQKRTSDEIRLIERMYDLTLPHDYRQFLSNYGVLAVDDVAIYGIGDPEQSNLFVEHAIFALRLSQPALPRNIVPIEDLGDGQLAGLVCQSRRSDEAPVVLIETGSSVPLSEMVVLAPSFREYLYNRLVLLLDPADEGLANAPSSSSELSAFQAHGLKVLEQHVLAYQEQFDYDHAKGGKLPRNHDWRPYRFCIQDVLFGATVVRHNREHNSLEIDVFLTATVPQYDELAGAQALACFLLSEAYKCGGTMELRFTRAVEGGRVPTQLQALAGRYGIAFGAAAEGRVTPAEARQFYAVLTGFSSRLQEQLADLERAGTLKMTRACYAVHHGIWSREQVEMLVVGSRRADRILAGVAQPHQRMLYQHDLLYARGALLGGLLDRQLMRRERQDTRGRPYDLEDDLRELNVRFDGELFAKIYTSPEPIQIPWLYPERRIEIHAGHAFNVFIRARDSSDLLLHLIKDIETAHEFRNRNGLATFIVVPRDFLDLPETTRQQILAQSETLKLRLLVCPEGVQALDADAAQRLARSRLLRK